eukprot:m.124456 g.124456  ORF g.124456 m.124456 type:complete len:751 (+) comp9347_c0_seq2:91-2343(+)
MAGGADDQFNPIVEGDIVKLRKNDKGTSEIDWTEQYCGNIAARAVGRCLKTNTCLVRLCLDVCDIDDDGLRELAEGLCTNLTLADLSLKENSISNKGAMLIAGSLKINKALVVLNLANNRIEDSGARRLAEALVTNTTLRRLELSSNMISDEGACCFGEAIKSNKALQKLFMDGNDINDRGAVGIIEGVRANVGVIESVVLCSTTNIGLSNQISDPIKFELAELLKHRSAARVSPKPARRVTVSILNSLMPPRITLFSGDKSRTSSTDQLAVPGSEDTRSIHSTGSNGRLDNSPTDRDVSRTRAATTSLVPARDTSRAPATANAVQRDVNRPATANNAVPAAERVIARPPAINLSPTEREPGSRPTVRFSLAPDRSGPSDEADEAPAVEREVDRPPPRPPALNRELGRPPAAPPQEASRSPPATPQEASISPTTEREVTRAQASNASLAAERELNHAHDANALLAADRELTRARAANASLVAELDQLRQSVKALQSENEQLKAERSQHAQQAAKSEAEIAGLRKELARQSQTAGLSSAEALRRERLRLAEYFKGEFVRRLTGRYASSGMKIAVECVEVIKPRAQIENKYDAARQQLEGLGCTEAELGIRYLFREFNAATADAIIDRGLRPTKCLRCKCGLAGDKTPADGGHDAGHAGNHTRGVYLAVHPDAIVAANAKGDVQAGDTGKIMLFEAVTGKIVSFSTPPGPIAPTRGMHCHETAQSPELFIFDPAQVVPRAIIHWRVVDAVGK